MSYAYSEGYEELLAEASDKKRFDFKKEHKSESGGLTEKGRKAYNKKTGGNLKPPVSKEKAKKSPKAAGRRKSFCARMTGQKKMHNIDCSKTPEKRICKALRKWDC